MARWLPATGRTAVMGILNVTPDSFSDGGRYAAPDAALARAEELVAEGADLIDVGGESTRPGAMDVDAADEIGRTVPVIERIVGLGLPISIDTRKAAVAEAALDAGAEIVNDVSGGSFDEALLPLVARRGVTVILMHMRGDPRTMDDRARYHDVVAEVRSELADRVRAAREARVAPDRMLVDPGLGFAKTPEQSLELLGRIQELAGLGPRLVVGPSRKRFVGHVGGRDVDDRMEGTAAAVAWCATMGVDVVRVHDVRTMRRVVEMIHAIRSVGGYAPPRVDVLERSRST